MSPAAPPDTPHRARSRRLVTDAAGHEFALEEVDCPVCGPTNTRYVGRRGGETHRYGLGVETSIVECLRCGLLYANPYPTPTDFQQLYGDPEKYFVAHDLNERTLRFQKVAERALEMLGIDHPSLLDVGSGRGEMLVAARQAGIDDAIGLEPSAANRDFATGLGVTLLPQTIEQYARDATRTFSIITLNAILEHVPNPDEMISCCHQLLSPGGILYIDVPNEANLVAMVGNTVNRLRGSEAVFNLSPTFPPYHVFGFTKRSIRFLLSKHGFTIADLQVHAWHRLRAQPNIKDRLRVAVAMGLQPIANLTGTAHNMYIWARK